MSFSKTALLTSLTCFTLGMGSLGAALYISSNGDGDADNVCCYTSDGCGGKAPLNQAMKCWNAGDAGPMDFIVSNTDLLTDSTPEVTRVGTLQMTSSISGGTILSSDTGAFIVRTVGSGVIVEIGPSGSEQFSMGGSSAPALRTDQSSEIHLGPQFVYPLSNHEVNGIANADSNRFEFVASGLFRFSHTGTIGTEFRIAGGQVGQVYLEDDVVLTANTNFYLNADEGAKLLLLGGGLSSQLISLQTNATYFRFDHTEIQNSTFGMSVNPGGAGTITFNHGALQFVSSFELADNHNIDFLNTGTFEVLGGVTATLTNDMSGIGLLVKTGGGKLELRGTSSQSGGISIQDGTISLDQAGRITTSQIEIISPGVLELTTSIALSNTLSTAGGAITILNGGQGTFTGALSGSSSFGINDGSTDETAIFSYSGNGSGFSGALTFSNVEFSVGSASSTSANMDIVLENGASLTLNNHSISIKSLVGTEAAVNLGSGTLSIYQVSSTATIDAVISGEGGSLNLFSANSNDIAVVLEGANTFTGGVTIGSNVSLEITDAENLGAGTSVRIEDEGKLTIADFDNDVVLAQGFDFISGTGRITLDTNSTTLEIGGEVTGSGSLYLLGDGSDSVLTLANISSSYSGAITIDDAKLVIRTGVTPSLTFKDGTLKVEVDTTLDSSNSIFLDSGGGAFLVDSGKKLSILGAISGTNGVTFSGDGTTLLSGINTYTGDTEITKGIVQISSDNNLGASSEDVVFTGDETIPVLQVLETMDSARNMKIQGNGSGIKVDSGKTATFTGAVNIRSGPPAFIKSGAGDLVMLPVTPSSLPQLTVSVLEGSMTASMFLLENSSVAVSSGATFIVRENGDASYFGANDGKTISGDGSFIKEGEAALNFLVPLATSHSQLINTYKGGTEIRAGVLAISVDRALGDPSGTLTMNGGTLRSVIVDGDSANTVSSSRAILLNVDSAFDTACNTSSPCSIGSPCCSILELSGVISGSGGLTKTSNGTLSLLNTANTYLGTTNINGGTLKIAASGSLGTSSSITFNGATLEPIETMTLSQGMSILSDGGTFVIGKDKELTLSGVISGEGGATFSGAGTTVLTGTNTYKGNTTLKNGIVKISSNANLGGASGSIVFNGSGTTPKLQISGDVISKRSLVVGEKGAEVIVDSGITASFTGNVAIGTSAPYSFIKSGDGNLSILPTSPSLVPSLNVDVQSGNMTGNMYFLRSSSIQIASGSTVTLNTDVDALYVGAENGATISGEGGITITGTSELALLVPLPGKSQSYNTYSGNTRLEEGILTISAEYNNTKSGVLGSSSSTLIGAGGTLKTVVLSGQTGNVITSERDITLVTNTDTTFFIDCNTTDFCPAAIPCCSTFVLNGDITGGGGLIKDGAGTLALAGDNTYTGGTTVNEGRLVVTGAIDSATTVLSNGALRGNGTVGNVDVFGGLAAGSSIGDMLIDGDLVLYPGSTFYVELSTEAASSVEVTGTATIASEATLFAVPNVGVYTGPVTYVVLDSLSGITGTFSKVLVPESFYMTIDITYAANEVTITLTPESVSPVGGGNNADVVADALNKIIFWNRFNAILNIPNIYEGSNIEVQTLLESLLPINNTVELGLALDQMHPAALKGVVIAQENATVQVQESLSTRLNEEMETLDCARTRQAYTFWINGMGAATNQDNNTYKGSPQAGYNNTMAGFVAGADYRFKDLIYVGALGGYTSSYLSFEKNRGSGNVHTGYFGLYTSVIGEGYFANASVTGGWNGYSANRHIEYTGVNVTAKNSHGGRQLMSHIEGGLNLPAGKFNIRPFDRFDYLTQKEYGYSEKDAGDWNLSVNKNTSILLRNELGLQFASCFQVKTGKITLSPKVSWVREIRTRGSTYTAAFTDAEDFSFTVKGYFPNRSLFSTGGVITGSLLEDKLSLSAYYDGEFTGGYSAHRYGGEVRVSF